MAERKCNNCVIEGINWFSAEIARVVPAICLLTLLALTASSCIAEATPTAPTRTPKPTFTVTVESTADSRLVIKTPTALPSATMTITPTETPVPTLVPAAVPTPTTEATRTPLAKPTSWPTESPVHRPEPTRAETVAPVYPYGLVGQPKFEPNCGTVYINGMVVDQQGNPVNGVPVQLSFYDNRVIRNTGEGGEGPGSFGFAPLARGMFKTPVDFGLEIVGPNGERGLSPVLDLPFTDCDSWGQATGIVFKKTR